MKRNAESKMVQVGFDGILFWEKYQGGNSSVHRVLRLGIYIKCWCTFPIPGVKVSDTKSRGGWKGLKLMTLNGLVLRIEFITYTLRHK